MSPHHPRREPKITPDVPNKTEATEIPEVLQVPLDRAHGYQRRTPRLGRGETPTDIFSGRLFDVVIDFLPQVIIEPRAPERTTHPGD
jgi:hypothetical protein